MARKKSAIPPATRIRENQRRSRERHREYVTALRERLATLEAAGVQASLEIQRAGRRVARENTLLRELLTLRGVEPNEVEEFLRARWGSGGEIGGRMERGPVVEGNGEGSAVPGVATGALEAEPLSVPDGNRLLLEHYQPVEHPDSSIHHPHPPYPALTATLSQPLSEPRTLPSPHPLSESQTPTPALSTHCSTPDSDVGLDRSCHEAAVIIATMRGHNDTEWVRRELGCEGMVDCRVKNADLLDVMDSGSAWE
ncbi:hypothetical protein EJ06DRAFT_578555, partial [Trichodelitschia bisporula]